MKPTVAVIFMFKVEKSYYYSWKWKKKGKKKSCLLPQGLILPGLVVNIVQYCQWH